MLAICLALIDDEEEKIKFTEIINNYERKMFAYSMSILHNEALAEEAMWDGFYYVAKNFFKIKDEDMHKIEAYIIMSVKDACYRVYNKEKKHSKNISMDDDDVNIEPVSFDSFNSFQTAELEEALKTLDKVHKDVIIYKFYFNFTGEQIADTLGISKRTVYNYLNEAKELLRKELESI
ncbi:MAG TPA: hypothetical protein DCS12_08035 [Clostridiales bacterium]|nr:hypothetical protein [Clostridiales bacterium]